MTPLPAAPLQSAMLAASRGHPGAYVQQVEIAFPTTVNPARIAPAFSELFPRFPALCQEFSQNPDGTVAVTLAETPRLTVHEETQPPPIGDAWSALLAADRIVPVSGHRLRWWPDARRVLWTFSHALLDGRSTAEIVRAWVDEVVENPSAKRLDWQPWQPIQAEAAQRAAQAWRGQFPPESDDSPFLPSDYHSATRQVSFDADAIAANLGVTVHTIAQVSAALIVGQIMDRTQVVLGQVRSCPPPDTAGLWINTVPLVLAWSPSDPLRAFALRALDASRSLREIARISPDQWLPIVRPETRVPWDAVLMSERGTLAERVGRPNVQVALHERSSDPLVLAAYFGKNPVIQVESTGLPKHTVEWVADAWKNLLETLAQPLETTCESLIGTDIAIEPTLPTSALYPTFADAARQHSHRPAVSAGGHSITYGQLADEIESLAAALVHAGVVRGDRVAVLLADRRLLPTALLAIQRLGAIFVPLDPDHPSGRHDGLWLQSSPRLLISDRPPWRPELPRINPRQLPADQPAQLVDISPPAPDADAALLFTSGSTGEPKGVRLVGGAIANEARALGRLIGMTREDRVLQFASPGFDAFLEEVFLALLHGAALVPRTSEMMADFAIFTAGLVHEKISVADLPTAFWRGWTAWLARNPGCFPECLRCVIIGGEAATEAALASWRTIAPDGCQLWNTYGPTEATIVATAHPLHRWPAGRSGDPPIGRPLERVAVRVAGRDGSSRPPGLVGEIRISGCGVSPGYWQRPDLDAVFVTRGTKRWYRSGDLAAWNGDGDLVFLGRMDDQIKLRGHRIEPDEVRRQVERIEGVRTAHVALAGQPPMLTAWIVPTSADAELPLRVRQSLAARLPSAMVPAAIIPVAELPLTSRGKVDRRRLPEPAPLETTASEDPMTAWACRVFAEILERPVSEIDPEREFQRQGGDSISALELALRLRDAGLSIEPGDLAHDSSPSAVARRFSQPSKSHPTRWEPIVVLRPGKAGYPPLVLIHATPGDVLGYGNLAAELPDHLPCWGIVSRALHEPERPHRSIPAMAADYLKELQARLGDAPFVLGGWCYGGLVAYEMACTLHRMNRPPPLRLLLIETWCPQPASRVRALRLRLQQARAFLGLATDHRRGYLRQKLENRRVTPAETPASETRRDATFRHNLAAALGFRADPYPLPVDLFLTQATANDTLPLPEGGWSALAKNRTIHPCAGGHADLLHPPNVGTLAAQIASLFPSPI